LILIRIFTARNEIVKELQLILLKYRFKALCPACFAYFLQLMLRLSRTKMGWVVKITDKITGLKNKLADMFVDREFFMRANGQVKFLKIPAQLQRKVAGVLAICLGAWLVVTLGMAVNQVAVSAQRMALSDKEAQVQSAEQRVAKYRNSIDGVTKDLSKRQALLETLYNSNFPADAKSEAEAAVTGEESEKADKISTAVPGAADLALIEARQIRFAEKLIRIADLRARRAEKAIRGYGLNPASLAGIDTDAQGGPFIPFFGSENKSAAVGDPRFNRLARALDRMKQMERSLASIPTSMPAAVMNMSSNYGYRRDPITGHGAMHSGIDFKGPHATPILAAADGKVTKAGWNSGYGKTIEITHANGLVTRYAHLSSFTVSLGETVKHGVQIGRMGSTGRSTGTHLHFEVRLNGRAVNPTKFLETNPDVLKIKADAGIPGSNAAGARKSGQ